MKMRLFREERRRWGYAGGLLEDDTENEKRRKRHYEEGLEPRVVWFMYAIRKEMENENVGFF